jgi:hypothetical protein
MRLRGWLRPGGGEAGRAVASSFLGAGEAGVRRRRSVLFFFAAHRHPSGATVLLSLSRHTHKTSLHLY